MKRYQLFLRGIATNWIGTLGVALATSAFLLFVAFELLRVAEVLTNAYVGLISYMALPALFILGLALIPLGWWRFRRRTGLTVRDLVEQRFPEDMLQPKRLGSSLVGMLALLTAVNVMFLGVGGARMLHFMDQPRFCGTACHGVMEPEWTAYQRSPHARVHCVECHVGEGAEALIDAKLNGLWQVVSATFDLYERPIPTPVHQLRPARETCERCHWPDKFYGERIRTFARFAQDSVSTPGFTTLALKVGAGSGEHRGTIHWHIADRNEVRYEAADAKRLAMAWVEVRRGDAYHRYTNRALDRAALADPATEPEVRTMDCVDCHNRATHIYLDPETAVDQALAAGRIDRNLPFAKRTALAALLGEWADKDAAMAGIEASVRGSYARMPGGARWLAAADTMTAVLQDIYAHNVFPEMNVGWNTYPSHLGHRGQAGCFRCHNRDMVDDQGNAVPYDCTLCHSILALDSATPFRFLQPVAENDPDRRMHEYLRDEFLGPEAAAAFADTAAASANSRP